MEPDTLELFAAYCAQACDENLDKDTDAIIVTEDLIEEGVVCAAIKVGTDPDKVSEAIESMVIGRRFAALATRTNWSPNAGPSSLAWCFVAVEDNRPAFIAVRRQVEDTTWTRIRLRHAPWFALSTAGSLKGLLGGRETKMVTRAIADERLLATPADGVVPPTYPDGKI